VTALAVLVLMCDDFTVSENIENSFSCENIVTKIRIKNILQRKKLSNTARAVIVTNKWHREIRHRNLKSHK